MFAGLQTQLLLIMAQQPPPGSGFTVERRCDWAPVIDPIFKLALGNLLGISDRIAVMMLLVSGVAVMLLARSRKVTGWVKALGIVLLALLMISASPALVNVVSGGSC